jgi:hypothetical protein
MSTIKQVVGARTALTVTGLGTLASATYVASAVIDNTVNNPVDVMIEVTVATTNTPAGNKTVNVFAISSYDNSNYQTGPTSGTTTTDEPLLTYLGSVPLQTASVTERKSFSLAAGYGGVLPPFAKTVIKNDLGVALTTGSVTTSEISVTVT